jgi:hypothetical protein
MSSISIGVMRVRTTVERVVAIEDVGKAIVRWGLVVVLRPKLASFSAAAALSLLSTRTCNIDV